MGSRPEHTAPPDIFYDESEAQKYAQSSRMIEIQTQMSERAIELLKLPPGKPSYILDVGCGTALSGEVLSNAGHEWMGMDISRSMLGVAKMRGADGDLAETDMGQGVHFRPGVFDGCISISALQWLCNADNKNHKPHKRLKVFFTSLYNCLAKGARAVFQFYPETPQAMELITSSAMRCGFSGGLVVDYPNSTKAKKIYLCLFAGEPAPLAAPLEGDEPLAEGEARTKALFEKDRTKTEKRGKGKRGTSVKDRSWIQAKKERQRKQGKDNVPHDSKFTGRKRGPKF